MDNLLLLYMRLEYILNVTTLYKKGDYFFKSTIIQKYLVTHYKLH